MRRRLQILEVDIVTCDGRGVCAELFPERIDLDDWGYPIIDPAPIGGDLIAHATRAIAACPVLALRLEPAPLASPSAPTAVTVGRRGR